MPARRPRKTNGGDASHGVLWTLLIAAALLAAAVGLRGPVARRVAFHWQRQLAGASDAEVYETLDRIAGLGEPGFPALVETLDVGEPVGRAAKRTLLAEMARWQRLPSGEASRKLAALAEALAGRVDRLGVEGKLDAADLADRILLWPLDGEAVEPTDVIACCERVLRAAARAETEGRGADARSIASAEAPGGAARSTETRELPDFAPPTGDIASDFGGSRGFEGVPLPDELQSAGPAPMAELSLPPLRPIEESPSEEGTRQPPVVRLLPAPAAGPIAGRPALLPDGENGGTDLSVPPSDWSRLETVEVMRRLRADSRFVAAGARAELSRRGFSEVHLELARRLFDPDPEVRKQLARVLPNVQSVDATPWLFELARDPDAEVRRTALALITTTEDPELLRRAERISRDAPRR